MRLPPRPANGYPHEQPGYKFFSTPWPPGYKPHLADEAMLNHQKRREADAARAADHKY